MVRQVDGKTALVAASSKGLGFASAKELAAGGANIAICSRDTDRLAEAKTRLIDATDADPDLVLTVECDLTDTEAIRNLVNETIDTFGELDILVNNHGGVPSLSLPASDLEDWDRSYRLCIRSNVCLTKEAVPYLIESGDGAVVTITAATAKEPPTGHVISNVFRLGLFGFTKTIAKEYGPEVRANCVAPGYIMTDRVEERTAQQAKQQDTTPEEVKQSRNEKALVNRPGRPQELAETVAFLASPASSYITGEAIVVNGGASAGVF